MAPFNLNLPEIRLWLPINQKVQVALSAIAIAGIGAYAYLGVFTPEAQKVQGLRSQVQQAKRDYDLLVQSAKTIEDQKRSIRRSLARISFFDLQEDPFPDVTAKNRAMVFLYQVADLAKVTGNQILDMQIGELQAAASTHQPTNSAATGAAIAQNAMANPGQVLNNAPPNGATPSAAPSASDEAVRLLPITVTLQLRGTYPELKDFLQAVRDLSPLVQLESFNAAIKKSSKAEAAPGATSQGGQRPQESTEAADMPQADASPGPLAEDQGPFNSLDSQLVFKVNFLEKGQAPTSSSSSPPPP